MTDNNIQAVLVENIEVNEESIRKFKKYNKIQNTIAGAYYSVVIFSLVFCGFMVGGIVTDIMIINELKSNIQSDWFSNGVPQEYEGQFSFDEPPEFELEKPDDNLMNVIWDNPIIREASAYPTPDKKVIYVQLVYIASGDSCDGEDLEAMNFYSNLAQYYFEKYEYLVADRNEYCQLYKDSWFVDYNPNYDLTIIMLDYENSKLWQKQTNWYGMHSWSLHNGQNVHYIITTSQFDRTYDIEAAWTLTHEISHFVITNLRLPNSYHDDYVHKIQMEYDDCKPEIWKCKHLYDTAVYKPELLDGKVPVAVMKPLLDYSVVS